MNLLQGDCLELMKNIEPGSVDMVLCDPPYGTTRNEWDIVIDPEAMWGGLNRALKPDGAAVMFSQLPFAVDLISANRKNFRYEWIWEKACGTGFLNARRMPLKLHENVLVFYRKLPTYHPQMRTGFEKIKKVSRSGRASSNYGKYSDNWAWDGSSGERFPIDIIKFPEARCTGEKGLHPTQKPVALLEYLIKTYTDEGDVVMDICMGSGSTGVACVHTGRDFIGMEMDGEYFQAAQKRIIKEYLSAR